MRYYKLKKGKYLVALNKLNFGVDSGDFVAVVGESGCGKTTLIKSLLGSSKLVEGDIYINGRLPCGAPRRVCLG